MYETALPGGIFAEDQRGRWYVHQASAGEAAASGRQNGGGEEGASSP